MLTEAELLKQVMKLPAPKRSAMAQKLLESLESADASVEEVDAAWAVEIEKRAASYDRGDTESIDGRDAIKRIRESIQRGTRP